MATAPRILFIDAYDSFSNSIVGLLQEVLHAFVHVVRINDGKREEDLIELIRGFDAVVVGPGPGHPANPQDIGLVRYLWTLDEAHMIPVLGVCLGFQSMGLTFGGSVTRLREARHGCVCSVVHDDRDLFEGVGELQATQYHSLQVVLPNGGDSRSSGDSPSTPMIQPLAHTIDAQNGKVLMALKVEEKPFWGIQFHPESICTSSNGTRLISNWWKLSTMWLMKTGRMRPNPRPTDFVSHGVPHSVTPVMSDLVRHVRAQFPSLFPVDPVDVNWRVTASTGCTASDICEGLSLHEDDILLLDSQGHASGRYSILGLEDWKSGMQITWNVVKHTCTLIKHTDGMAEATAFTVESQEHFWHLIKEIMTANQVGIRMGPSDIPFWGGFIGYVSYEAGLDTLKIATSVEDKSMPPDISFTWVSRCLVVDHVKEQVYIQHLGQGGMGWAADMAQRINMLVQDHPHGLLDGTLGAKSSASLIALDKALGQGIIQKPTPEQYCAKVNACKAYLVAGDSYELCLTDQTKIYLPTSCGPAHDIRDWMLYKKLRTVNPAPFGAFLNMAGVTVVGSSPERFLSWTRQGSCQFRPIKGTVKKGSGVDFEAATKILSSQKERAENLMIVDLIRHDLSGIVGSDNCSVSKLMQVEEYETVFQLVSVIEGKLSRQQLSDDGAIRHSSSSSCSSRGIDVLAASLPPGSMTGAPKKRSCELLTQLEGKPRGLYSGVIGYMDVGGGGDFSVVIRSAVKQRNELVHVVPKPGTSRAGTPHQVWRVGAGGAVTTQSTDIGEFEEMETKLDSVLQAFKAGQTRKIPIERAVRKPSAYTETSEGVCTLRAGFATNGSVPIASYSLLERSTKNIMLDQDAQHPVR